MTIKVFRDGRNNDMPRNCPEGHVLAKKDCFNLVWTKYQGVIGKPMFPKYQEHVLVSDIQKLPARGIGIKSDDVTNTDPDFAQ
jgi:hypothetical protein